MEGEITEFSLLTTVGRKCFILQTLEVHELGFIDVHEIESLGIGRAHTILRNEACRSAFHRFGKAWQDKIWFGGMTITGADANKLYQDHLVTGYDSNKKPIVDDTKNSFSTTWFLQQPGNRADASTENWLLQPLAGLTGVNIVPAVGSPLLHAGSFNGVNSTWFDQVGFIGAFGTENWTLGWANFDPQHTDY